MSHAIHVMSQEIHHSVFFKLTHEIGSVREKLFFDETRELLQATGITSYQIVRKIGLKNGFDYGLIVTFPGRETYDAYSLHPAHLRYVSSVWKPQVKEFIEIDWSPEESE
jgi:hypothetical protein